MITNAVILAAGRGTHLWPYGDTCPKAALPVGNSPLIHHQLASLAEVGIQRVTVVCGFLEGTVKSACENWLIESGADMEIRYVTVPTSKGTAHSARLGLEAGGAMDSPAILVPGDLFFCLSDLQRLVSEHTTGTVSCLTGPVSPSHSQDCIQVTVDRGRVKAVHAHSRGTTPEQKALSGLVIIPGDFIGNLEATPEVPTCVEIGAMPAAGQEVFETIHQFIRNGGEVRSTEAEERLIDIDRPWDLLEANMLACEWFTGCLAGNEIGEGAFIDPSARLEGYVSLGAGSLIGPGVTIYGNLVVGKNTVITDGAYVCENSMIGDDCRIWRGCLVGSRTVIGHRCVVGHGAEVEGVMMDESYSYHYGEYWGILGRCCDLGAATVCGTLRFDDGETMHRIKGRKERPRWHANATYLGDFVRTGVNAILMPGVKVGPYSLIGAGVVLNEDVPNNTGVFIEQTLKRASWGPERYGW